MNFKVPSAEISHETNTYNVYPTTVRCFVDRYLLKGDQAIAKRGNQNTELAGLLVVGRNYGWDINHVLIAAAGPGGRVTGAAFDVLMAPLLAAAENKYEGAGRLIRTSLR